MKRLTHSSMSGKERYGPKWQNTESSSDSESNDDDHIHSSPVKSTDIGPENDDDDLHSAPVGSTETAQVPSIEEATIPQGNNITRRSSLEEETMYRAAIKGDWLAAEVLLSQNPNLATDYVTDEGDRAPHVAAAMKHKNFVQNLVNRMTEDDLSLLDGHGYTAFCYAAVSGGLEIARLMIEKKPNLVTTHDANNVTSLHKAALSRRNKMVSYLLKSTEVEDLSNQEWFDILLVAIQRKMLDVAIELVAKNYVIATMSKDERTALHLLAQFEMSNVHRTRRSSILLETIFGVDLNELSGGYDSQTGMPILLERKQFKNFLSCELLGLTGSVLSILLFRSVMTSSFAELDFLTILPLKMFFGFELLLVSLLGAIRAFMSSFELVKLQYGAVQSSQNILYIACYFWLFREFGKTLDWDFVDKLRKSICSDRHTLFS